VSAYRTAIDETTRTIDLRARYFRNQIVIVVSIGALVVAVAFFAGAAALWAWLLIVPACAVFFYVDARVLNSWREAMLGAWISPQIDFEVLRQTIRANPAMPKGTAEGMLETLPDARDLVSEQKLETCTRAGVAAVSLAMHRTRADALLLQTIASAIVVAAVLAALWTHSWNPLSAIASVAALPAVRVWAARRRLNRAAAEVAACRRQDGFSEAEFERLRAALK
jgi:hypothetical protein